MRSGGLYFRFFHYVLLICLLIGSILFGYAIVEVYKPDLMVPGVAWYYFGVQPGFVLFPVIGLGIFVVLASLYRFLGVFGMTLAIAACGFLLFFYNISNNLA